MPFNSFAFAAFLTVVVIATAITPARARWLVLLAASYVFYASFRVPYLVGVLVLVTGLSYVCGLAMAKTSPGTSRRWLLLWLGISANVLTLLVLRYTGFLAQNVASLLALIGIRAQLVETNPFASVGVSFFVFQAISYLTDVYLETDEAQRHLGLFALHLALFSKLTQGPIERASHLLPQLREPLRLTLPNAAAGLSLLFWGLFKKVVVADRLAPFVAAGYSDVRSHTGLPLVLATYLFAFQLYYDFSGYTDMARGTARLFGLDLVENFDRPYLARSVADFWRHWHMSFTSWVLEYIFKPLQFGLRRWRTWGPPISLLVTFLISGLWHGASWCFVVWGGLHGTFMGVSLLTAKWRRRLATRLRITDFRWLPVVQLLITFHLVCLAWIFFRAQSLADALYVARASVAGLPATLASVLRGKDLENLLWIGRGSGEFVLAWALIAFTAGATAYRRRTAGRHGGRTSPARAAWAPWARTTISAVAFYLLAFHGASAQSFIYVQF